jgi:hypothetical protein
MITDMTEIRTSRKFSQVLAGSGAAFRRITSAHTARANPTGNAWFGLGHQKDYTVIAIIDADKNEMVAYERSIS